MKQFKTLLLIAILTVGFTTTKIQAQTKIGHINTDQLLSLMPETKAMNDELTKLGQTYDAQLKEEQTKLQDKLKKYQAEAATQTDEENQKRSEEVQQDQQNLYKASQAAKDDLDKKRNEKLKPILDKAKKAIEDVAKEKSIEYVLDDSSLIVANGTDLMPAVKAKLGLK